MKRTTLALAVALGASVAQAQAPAPAPAPAPEAIKHDCNPVPEYPGRLGMQIDSRRKSFDRDMRAYEACMKSFVEARKAAIAAQETAARQAVDEYNATITRINKEREADNK
jgi:hypothetical protein